MKKVKKTYKIEVDCAECAKIMENIAKKTPGIADAEVSYMTLKMKVEFGEKKTSDSIEEEDVSESNDKFDPMSIMQTVLERCKTSVEHDCTIYL